MSDIMARPRKQNTDIMQNEIVEIKATADSTYVAEPNESAIVSEPVIVESKPVEDVASKIEVEVVRPKVQEQDKERMPTPICDIAELTEEDKQILIEKKIKNILDMSQIGVAFALVRFREPDTTSVPPMYALVEYDHRFVDEGWDFYKTNVRNPHFKDYLDLITRVTGKPSKIYPRLVLFNYE